jgi:RNA polymerase sigma-70 factor (ECF subfamily)
MSNEHETQALEKYTEEQLVNGCRKNNRVYQHALYERYSSRMFSVCLRYASDRMLAEDFLQEGFIRVFTKIDQYKNSGSLEGWIKRIMVNTALQHIRRAKQEPPSVDSEEGLMIADTSESALDTLAADEVLALVAKLPAGYRLVFNLYVLEEYTHQEIAAELGISEGTSKSQLARARQHLQKMLKKNETIRKGAAVGAGA